MNLAGFSRAIVVSLATLSVAWSQAPSPARDSHSSTSPGSASPDSVAPDTKDVSVQPEPDAKSAELPNQTADPLLDLPGLKSDKASLIGGTLQSLDRVQSRLVLRPFGRGTLTIAFDPRTRFLRGEDIVGVRDLHPGDRIYVETVLEGSTIFAKAIHMSTGPATGIALGQVVAYDAARGSLSLRDRLSSKPVPFRVTSTTIITGAGIGQGALVQVNFQPGKDAAVAREIVVLAAPGSVFIFAGRVTFLDLSSHELVVANISDNNRYEIQFNPAKLEPDVKQQLQEGINVTIAARFNGQRYVADSVTMLPTTAQ
jgi:hypothetical protein